MSKLLQSPILLVLLLALLTITTVVDANCYPCGPAGPAIASAALTSCPSRNSLSDEQCPYLMSTLSGPRTGCSCYNFCGGQVISCGATTPLTFCSYGAPVNGCVESERLTGPAPTPPQVGAAEGCGYCPANAVAKVACVKTPFNFATGDGIDCECKPNYILDSGTCKFCIGCAPSVDVTNPTIFERDGCIIDTQFCYPRLTTNLIQPQPVPQPIPQPVPHPIPQPVPQPVIAAVVTCPPGQILNVQLNTCFPAPAPIPQPTATVVAPVTCPPGQILNVQYNTCFPAPQPTTTLVVGPAPVPVATFIFGNDDDCESGSKGSSKGSSGSSDCGGKGSSGSSDRASIESGNAVVSAAAVASNSRIIITFMTALTGAAVTVWFG